MTTDVCCTETGYSGLKKKKSPKETITKHLTSQKGGYVEEEMWPIYDPFQENTAARKKRPRVGKCIEKVTGEFSRKSHGIPLLYMLHIYHNVLSDNVQPASLMNSLTLD